MRNETWKLVKRPPDRSVVTWKWEFTRKRNSVGKLVSFGCNQRKVIDFQETYSPVARMTTLRMMLALAVQRKLEIHQMDVKTAFLNGKLQKIIYMELTSGFERIEAGIPCVE